MIWSVVFFKLEIKIKKDFYRLAPNWRSKKLLPSEDKSYRVEFKLNHHWSLRSKFPFVVLLQFFLIYSVTKFIFEHNIKQFCHPNCKSLITLVSVAC